MRKSREAIISEEWDTLKRRTTKLFKALTSFSLRKSFLNLTIKEPFSRQEQIKEPSYLIYGLHAGIHYGYKHKQEISQGLSKLFDYALKIKAGTRTR